MKHRIIFHMYIPDTNELPKIYNVHFACLKEFMHIFDDAIFVLSAENINNKELIRKYQSLLLDIDYFGKLTFVIEENDKYEREQRTFKKYIVDDAEPYDGLTFFAHSKGASNEYSKSLIDWVSSMYFGCLEDIDKVDTYYCDHLSAIFYGAFIDFYNPKELKTGKGFYMNWHYPGTLYWISTSSLKRIMKLNNTDIWTTGKFLAEVFPGLFSEEPIAEVGAAWAQRFFYHSDSIYMKDSMDYYIKEFYFDKESYEKFAKFKNQIVYNKYHAIDAKYL